MAGRRGILVGLSPGYSLTIISMVTNNGTPITHVALPSVKNRASDGNAFFLRNSNFNVPGHIIGIQVHKHNEGLPYTSQLLLAKPIKLAKG